MEDNEIMWVKVNDLAKKLTDLPETKHVLSLLEKDEEVCFSDKGMLINSSSFNLLTSDEAIKAITEKVGGKMVTTYKLRDWIFSRQRYWGEPIPLINCPDCGWVPVPEKALPVILPKVKKYQPTDTGESPLASITKWVNTKCPKCGGKATRETDTMPNWAGSSWYYLRYLIQKIKRFLPILGN